MSLAAKLLREPLLHFFVIGAAVFGLYSLTAGEVDAPRETIVVTDGRVLQLAEVFTRTWQRAPTLEELRGLADSYVEEEVYYREAIKRGLDRDDTLIRRRMQQKMEFLTEPAEDQFAADDAVLQAFLEANRERFRVEPMVGLWQVFVDPDNGSGSAAERAQEILVAIRGLKQRDAALAHADGTLLPATIPVLPLSAVAEFFGSNFTAALADLPTGAWAGPVESAYGLHLVWITEWRDGRDPTLAEVRAAVERDWRAQRRDEHREAELERLRQGYDVILPPELSPAVESTGLRQ